jgi:hypothetical protein
MILTGIYVFLNALLLIIFIFVWYLYLKLKIEQITFFAHCKRKLRLQAHLQ